MAKFAIDGGRIGHIFREAKGHFAEDTAEHRQILIEVASRPENFRGTDRFKNSWFAEIRADGTHLGSQIRGGRITNGGLT